MVITSTTVTGRVGTKFKKMSVMPRRSSLKLVVRVTVSQRERTWRRLKKSIMRSTRKCTTTRVVHVGRSCLRRKPWLRD